MSNFDVWSNVVHFGKFLVVLEQRRNTMVKCTLSLQVHNALRKHIGFPGKTCSTRFERALQFLNAPFAPVLPNFA